MILAGALAAVPVRAGVAQAHGDTAARHEDHHTPVGDTATPVAPTMAGQDAFAAIAEVVRMLDADPRTDWSTVNLAALREHLRDMDEVVTLSEVSQSPVPGGLTMIVVGYGRTVGAIKRMVEAHSRELARVPTWRVSYEALSRGARLTVVTDLEDARGVARIRGLGFAGLLTVGAHHQAHHLALARGGGHGLGQPH